MPPIGIWTGLDLGQHLRHYCGLDWIGFKKLDPCPTLRHLYHPAVAARHAAAETVDS